MKVKYTKEFLEKVVKKSFSVAQVLRKVGVKTLSGGIHSLVTGKIKYFKIDTSHFTGRAHNKGKVSNRRMSAKEILVYDKYCGRKEKTYKLRRALREVGVKDKCNSCGLGSFWNGRKLVLQIEHKNGDPLDNRLENLELLCPNCHSQTDTYGSKNLKPQMVKR